MGSFYGKLFLFFGIVRVPDDMLAPICMNYLV